MTRVTMVLGLLAPVFAQDLNRQVPIEITHENGSFTGQLAVAMTGTMNKAKTEWNGSIKNTSPHNIFRADFCVRAFDSAGKQIKPGDEDCVITLWGWNWPQGSTLKFKGKQDVKISEDKVPLVVSRLTVSAKDVFDKAPNIRVFPASCRFVWPATIRILADQKFRPTVVDKDSLTAAYAYDGGRIDGLSDSRTMLKAYTSANTAFFGPTWSSFRIDSASTYLREDKVGECTTEIKMSFAGFAKQWYAVDSNFNFEKGLLDKIGVAAQLAARADLDKGISQLPTEAPKVASVSLPKPQLVITSQPDGSEIEINGEFVGNAPATVTTMEGKVTIRVTKAGFQPWERTLTLSAGDKRTLVATLSK